MSSLNERAKELLAGRVAAVETLGRAVEELDELSQRLKSAEAAVASAWSGATAAGWTASELRKLGLHQPSSRRGGRPSAKPGNRKSAAPPSTPPTLTDPAEEVPA